jgi:hypothetical protein
MGDNKILFGADGRPIINNIGLCIVKVPLGSPMPTQQLMKALSISTHCNVVVLPFEYELATGKVAWQTIQRIHNLCHQLEEYFEQHKKPFSGSGGDSPN